MSDDDSAIERTNSQRVEMTLTQKVESPFPLASEIKGYEEVLPGAADRILSMVENQSAHRQELEKRTLEIEARNSLWGLIFAFVFAMSVLGSSVYLILTDHPEAAALVGAGGIGTAIGSFLQIRKMNNPKEKENDDD